MPEGDTIHRAARRLASALAGRTLTRFEAPRLVAPGPAPGTVIGPVEARGKYLLVSFGDGTVLETHMRMTGSWHLYRPGERWQRPPSALRVRLDTADWVALCFSAPHVVLHPAGLRAGGAPMVRAGGAPMVGAGGAPMVGAGGAPMVGAGGAPGLARLGPDLCTPEPDRGEILRRLAGLLDPATPLDVALLDQRVFCGVGNVYKSEVLYAAGLHPATPVGALGPDARADLVHTAHRLLRANLEGGVRTTVPGGLAVYGRAGTPCRRCGTTVARALTGPHHRSTYWCPRCQPAPPGIGPRATGAAKADRAPVGPPAPVSPDRA